MLKKIDRYILKEIFIPFIAGLIVYTFTLLIHNILLLSHIFINSSTGAQTIAKFLLYLMPDLLAFTVPMSTLMGVLAGLSRMSTDSEIVAYKTMGITNLRIFRPIMLFSIIAWVISSILIMYLAPEANYRLKRLNYKVRLPRMLNEIKPRTFCFSLPGYIMYFNDKDKQNNDWTNLLLYPQLQGEKDTIITASRGRFMQTEEKAKDKAEAERRIDNFIILDDVKIYEFEKKNPEKSFLTASYKHKKIKLLDYSSFRWSRGYNQLILPLLYQKVLKEPDNIYYRMELNRKFSLPFACIALAFLALSLGISTKKGGQLGGFVISLFIIFIYYTIMMNAKSLVLKGIIPPEIGMWLANIFLFTAGLFFFYFSSKEKQLNFSLKSKLLNKRSKDSSNKKNKLNSPFNFFNILDIYILKKIVSITIFIFVSIYSLFVVVSIVENIDNAIKNKVAIVNVFKYIFYSTPSILAYLLPVTVLTAILLSLSWMGKNNELTAIQVSGISLYRISLPAIFFGLFFSFLSFYIQENITPTANEKAGKYLNIIHNSNKKKQYELKKDWVIEGKNKIYNYNNYNKKKSYFDNFNILEFDDNFNLSYRLVAKKAFWQNKTTLLLRDGFFREIRSGKPINYEIFKRKIINIPTGKDTFIRKIVFSDFMNIKDLKQYISYLKKNNNKSVKYEANLYSKYAFPLSCLIMALIAIPFSFSMGKKGAMQGIGIAIGVSMFYWLATGIFNALGENGAISPFLSAFAPILLFLTISFYKMTGIKT